MVASLTHIGLTITIHEKILQKRKNKTNTQRIQNEITSSMIIQPKRKNVKNKPILS